MSFQGPDPYGTPGGTEIVVLPQTPEDVRIAKGRSYIIFMRTNGPITTRFREQVEDVIRVLGLTGNILVAIIVRENNVVRDANAGDLNFQDPFDVVQVAPGVINIDIGAGSITVVELADNAVETPKIKDGAVTLPKIAAGIIKLPGLVPLVQETVAPVATYSRNNVFSAAYKRYYISLSEWTNTGTATVQMRLRAGGVDDSGSVNYASAGDRVNDSGATGPWGSAPLGSWVLSATAIANTNADYNIWITDPGQAVVTRAVMQAVTYASVAGVANLITGAFTHIQATAYDGFTLFVASGQISGVVRVYGVTDSP